MENVRKWFETRVGAGLSPVSWVSDIRVPRDLEFKRTLGFVAFVAVAVQVLTGIFLLVYYIPHPDYAFRSLQYIMMIVPFGWLVRLMHSVGSNLLMAVVLIHMLTVLFSGRFSRPRELTWITGAFMLALIFAYCITGFLFPWSQLNYWATTMVTALPSALPFIGDDVSGWLRGGSVVSGTTLSRYFALHVGFLPLVFTVFLVLHIVLVFRTGFAPSNPEQREEVAEFRRDNYPDGHSLYPYYIMRGVFISLIYFAVMFFAISFVTTLILPESANSPADPMKTPGLIRPAWYFLAPYQLIKFLPNKFVAATLEIAIVFLLLFWPLFDTKAQKSPVKRPLFLTVCIILVVSWLLLTIWGRFS